MAQSMATRSRTNASDEDAIGTEDIGETNQLFVQRLQAWKHACGYLENYVSQTEKVQHAHSKEYEKVLKTVNSPLKEGDMFEVNNPRGISGMFESIRQNTQQIANTHADTAKNLKASVLPVFERLHDEIKQKTKELTKGVGKGSKAVDKARQNTQKHIELLGQNTSSLDSTGGKLGAENDPFLLHQGVRHRLNKQIVEENSTRSDMLTIQENFSQFEAHIVQTMQQGLNQFMQTIGMQNAQQKAMYANMGETSSRVQPLSEWHSFVQRNNDTLIDPNAPPRSLSNINFAHQNHKSTKALMQGTLERKSGLLKNYSTSTYVVTPAKYLHEFKNSDLTGVDKELSPDMSLYLPDCTVGTLNGNMFNVRGKDVSSRLSSTHEYAFRAGSEREAEQWAEVIKDVSSGGSGYKSQLTSPPDSPAVARNNTGSRAASGQQPLNAALAGGAAGGANGNQLATTREEQAYGNGPAASNPNVYGGPTSANNSTAAAYNAGAPDAAVGSANMGSLRNRDRGQENYGNMSGYGGDVAKAPYQDIPSPSVGQESPTAARGPAHYVEDTGYEHQGLRPQGVPQDSYTSSMSGATGRPGGYGGFENQVESAYEDRGRGRER